MIATTIRMANFLLKLAELILKKKIFNLAKIQKQAEQRLQARLPSSRRSFDANQKRRMIGHFKFRDFEMSPLKPV